MTKENLKINTNSKLKTFFEKANNLSRNAFSNTLFLITILLIIKTAFQLLLLSSGFRWLSADDFCRTVKSFEWLENPEISSGVWLTPHFWINGFFMIFIKDLFTAATIVSLLFTALSLVFFFKVVELCFDKKIAFISSLIFCFFPFQVWLSISGLPESIFFFYAIAGIYYFIRWKAPGGKILYLYLSSISFAFSNVFRYEGWLFSTVLVIFVLFDIAKEKKISRTIVRNFLVSLISFITIIWWFVQNYIDHNDFLFFAKETTKIFEQINTAKFFQRLVQYPIFIFYIAPITTVFSLKMIYDVLRAKNLNLIKLFLLFNLLELSLLMIQAMFGTGGTNLITRYVVINALLFLPFAVMQIFKYRKSLTVIFFTIIIIINIVWSFYFPQPFRVDTFEVGYFLKDQFNKEHINENENIYFEELEGYYDVWAVKTLSNHPFKFVLGEFPRSSSLARQSKDRSTKPSDDELNILDIKNFLESNKINLAIVKSDSYRDKLLKMNLKNDEIGDYKIFYIKDRETNVNDSTISLFSKSVISLEENQDIINFNKLIAINDIKIDNTNFGMNPQTVMLDWGAVDRNIIDSIDYGHYEFNRYQSLVEIKTVEDDSVVYTEKKRIFSDKNIEDLLEKNNFRTIIVLKPFAFIHYSMKQKSAPFESGVYYLSLKLRDNKYNKDLVLYQGNKLYKDDKRLSTDTDTTKRSDTLKRKVNVKSSKDSILYAYDLGNVIAMFPNTDYNEMVNRSSSDVYRIIMENGLRVFFSQRYQGDHFLNWVFTYF